MSGWQRVLICLVLVAGLLGGPRAALAAGGGDDYAAGQVVVRLQDGAGIDGVSTRSGARVAGQLSGGIYLLQLPGNLSVGQALKLLQADPDVRRVEPNYKLWAPEAQQFDLAFSGRYAVPSPDGSSVLDQNYVHQWAAARIGLTAAQERTRGKGMVVAILDTGADETHPALASRFVGGWDFVDNDADPSEPTTGVAAGHGTFMSGIVALLAPDAQILPVRVLNGDGTGTLFGVVAGIEYATDQGAQVINLSLGSSHDAGALKDAVTYATSRGVVVVASVGNRSVDDRSGAILYPARYSMTVAVAATDSDDLKATFSRWGVDTDLSAPGAAIYSTYLNHGYAWWSGTSSSAAFVSGGAALVWAEHPDWSSGQVTRQLESTAFNIDPLNAPAYRGKLGTGRLDLDAATR